jgi:diguanylate cyclase (GGDEF)-like protein
MTTTSARNVTVVRHAAPVTVGPGAYAEPRADASLLGRGAEHRVAALTLGILLFLGALMGTANLFVTGMVPDGPRRWLYAGTMLALVLVAVPLSVRRRVATWETFALVLLGDLIYVVIALCIHDPVRYATPLMLLFASFVAAWFLEPWQFAVNMAVTPVACLIAMWASYDGAGLAIQVVVSAGMLDAAAVGVFLLRRRTQRLLAETQALSRMDPLTGLSNRRWLEEQAPRVWRQARRDGTRVAAMVLDLDHFKRLNDAHGHAAGDAVLRSVANSLAASVRPADVLARTGGEELVVLGLVSDAAVAASRSEAGHGVTASVGVALTRTVDGEDPRNALWRLVDRADAAMYEAKQQGRDRVAALQVPQPRPARRSEQGPTPGPVPGAPASDVA